MPDRIELVAGAAPWLERARVATLLLAVISLGLAGTAWAWKLVSLGLLAGIHLAGLSRWRVHAKRSPIVLKREAGDIVSETGNSYRVLQEGYSWLSRWFCVFRLADQDTAQCTTYLVCASENHADDYRRMLVWLRLHPASERRVWAW